jgi:hypothetical protein
MISVDGCIIERFGGASRHPGRANFLAATTATTILSASCSCCCSATGSTLITLQRQYELHVPIEQDLKKMKGHQSKNVVVLNKKLKNTFKKKHTQIISVTKQPCINRD